jgi:hypothetical protein
MIVKECKMPDISDLKPSITGAFLLTSLVGLDANKTKDEISCLSVIARLIDKARYEYLIAREATIDEEKEGKLTYDKIIKRDEGQYLFTFTIINHLENCLNALSRIYKLHKLLTPKNQFLTPQKQNVNKTRNHIEHIEDRIARSITGSRSLNISGDALTVEIAGENLNLNDVANEIRLLYSEIRNIINK